MWEVCEDSLLKKNIGGGVKIIVEIDKLCIQFNLLLLITTILP